MVGRVSGNLQLVFSRKPHEVSDDEFNSWYDAHLPEILSIPGFVSARRFRLQPIMPQHEVASYDYLSVYELEGDIDAIMSKMEDLDLVSKESYAELKDTATSGPSLPPWWGSVRFASWNCVGLAECTDQI